MAKRQSSCLCNRHFLGWDEPLTAKIGKFLLAGRSERPVSLEGTLVVVPTRQAGRRLRETLTRMCAEQGTALLSARIVMPSFFLSPPPGAVPDANSAVVMAAWIEILMHAEAGGLIPDSAEHRDFSWAAKLGNSICQLRDELAEGGFMIRDAVKAAGAAIEEPERWADLARLESRFQARLAELNLGDSCERKVRQAASPPPDLCAEFKRIVVASVPDPMPLALKALEKMAERIPVDVLVWADESCADMFDEWGRPVPDAWEKAELDLPDVVLAGPPASQARYAMDRIGALPGKFGPRDLAIGVPDRSIMPFLENEMADNGLTGFDPSDRSVTDHAVYRLLAGFIALAVDGRYASVAGFLRQADFLQALEHEHGTAPARVLAELDEFHNAHLPVGFADFKNLDDKCSGNEETSGPTARRPSLRREGAAAGFGALKKAVEVASGFVATFEKDGLEAAVRRLLQAVYGSRRPGSDPRETREFARVLEKVISALEELGALAAPDGKAARFDLLSDKATVSALFLDILGQESYHADRRDEQVDLEGWLELPWNDAPALVVTGMNEGIVPSSLRGGQFLPNSLRRRLSLRDDIGRMARDAYFLRSLVESRKDGGHVSFIVGKTGISDEPLRPSRLLFRCSNDKLVERAAVLFARPRPERAVFPPTISFKLNARLPDDMAADDWQIKRMGATMFRDYLACPFRFYLKHILGMEEVDDTANAPDALQFGKLVHAVLEAMGREKTMRACDDEKQIAAFLHAEAERQARLRFGDAPSLSVAIALDTAMQRLSRAAKVQAELAGQGWEILSCEQKREMTVGGMTVVGKLDRIDRHRETGALRVLDYKTSDRNEEPGKKHLGSAAEDTPAYARVAVKEKPRRWLDLQLPIYKMLAEPGEKAQVEVGYFVLPKAVSETGVSLWPELDGELVESARTCVAGVAADIRRGRFWPPSEMSSYRDEFARLFHGACDACVDAEGFPFRGEGDVSRRAR